MNITTTHHQGPVGKVFGSIILVIFGIGLSFLSGFMTNRDADAKARCSAQVQAVVSGFEHSDDKDSKTKSKAVTPVFEYEYDGQQYTSKAGSYSSTYKDIFTVGQTYSLFIDPNDPVEIYSEDIATSEATMFKVMKWGGVALAILGVLSFIVSFVQLMAIGGTLGFAASKWLSK